MTYIAPAAAITARFQAYWAASLYSSVSTVYDNEIIDPPKPDPNDVLASSYVRQTILPNNSFGLTFTTEQTFGLIDYGIFTPVDAGIGYALEMAQTIRSIFNRITASGVTFVGPGGEGPSVDIVGVDDGFHHLSVTVHWQYCDTVTAASLVASNLTDAAAELLTDAAANQLTDGA